MLEQILMELQNWFRVRDNVNGIHPGTYTIENGGIALPFLRDGQYFRIMGSVFNDGLHQYGPDMEALTDETFDGTIWALAIPKSVVDAAAEAEAWMAKNSAIVGGVYSGESFGGYAYTKDTTAVDSVSKTGIPAHILAKVNGYRRLTEV